MPGAENFRLIEVDDPDRLDEVAPGVWFKARPLLGIPFHVSVAVLDIGDVCLQVGHTSPFVGLAACRDGYATLQIPFGKVESLVLNGTSMHEPLVGAYGPGGELQRANPRDNSYANLTFTGRFANSLGKANVKSRLFRRGTARFLRIKPAERERAVALVRKLALIAQHDPAAIRGEPSRLAVRAALLAAAQVLLDCGEDGVVRPPASARARMLILRAADDYIRANSGQPLYPDHVSTGIGVSVGDLDDAFQANFATSVSRLLTRRRLDLVRAAIADAEPSTVSIRAIAIAHGFWDLRGFEHAYQASFGESPADTLINARGYRGVLKVILGRLARQGRALPQARNDLGP